MTDKKTNNIVSVFETIAKDNTNIALVSGQTILSYQELHQITDQLAARLVALGVCRGDLVGITAERRVETIIGIMAILKAGGGYVPLPDYYPQERIEHIISVANIQIILGDIGFFLPANISHIAYSDIYPVTLEYLKATTSKPMAINNDDVAYVMFTSGSTGVPKGVIVPHRAILRLVVDQNYMCLDSNQRILQNSPIAFDASTLEIWGALLNGGTLVIPENQALTLKGLGQVIKQQKVTTLWLTAGLFHAIADERPADFLPLQQLLTGGDVVSPTKVAQVKKQCPQLTVINGYGPTENTTFTCCHTIQDSDLLNQAPLPIGKLINGTQAFVLDADLHAVAEGDEGELCVAGLGLALGYLGEELLTKAVFVPAPWDASLLLYRTGDLVRKDPTGIFYYHGRIDQQVKIRGFRVELGEIETAINTFTGVTQSVVVVIESADATDKQLRAYYTADVAINEQALVNFLRDKLPDYAVPSSLSMLSSLPLTVNGKVDKKALIALSQSAIHNSISHKQDHHSATSPTDIEAFIVDSLRNIIGNESINARANFFDMGASSLHIARLHERLEEWLNTTIRVTDIFLHSNPQALGAFLGGKSERSTLSSLGNENVDSLALATDDQIAIIGMAGRFPGANNVNEFWDALLNGRELISQFTDEELDVRVADTDKSAYVKARGILQDADYFDAQHFSISPRDAEKMDPQHRVLLELAQEALDDAGYDPYRYAGKIAVFAGNSQNSYLLNNIVSAPGAARAFAAGYPVKDFSTLFGNDKDFNVTRIAYKLNLRGPAVNVQCACSTSLVAIAQACDSLKRGNADMALAGGVSITFPQKRPYLYTPDGMASADGHCRTFDAQATGTVFGDGAGIVVLKRLQDALADGDDIVAVIRGYGINNDGSDKVGYAAPSIKAQAEVIKAAHRAAGVNARTIGYVEAHGTGTPLGDPIEFAALQQAFSTATDEQQFCALGTAKTNVGHLDIAAGVTGLIKTALTLKQAVIPPLLHYNAPNPNIDFTQSAFYPVTQVTPWPSSNSPRRAGVSAFGVGGTNIHMILEEAPVVASSPQVEPAAPANGWQLYPVSASSEAALAASVDQLGLWAARHPELKVSDVLYGLRCRRRQFDYRTVLLADGFGNLTSAATAYKGKGVKATPRDKIIMLLPGQGSQHVGMAKSLYQAEAVFREAFDLCATLLLPALGFSLIDIIQCPAEQQATMTALLKDTRIAQPAIFSIEYSLSKQWAHWGISPDILVGHSIGELAAACIANTIDLNDALSLIALRGQLMSDLPQGVMISVRASEQEIVPYLADTMDLAAVNGAKACVLAGSEEAAQELEAALTKDNIVFSRLHTSHAFHSRMMDPIVTRFEEAFKDVSLRSPAIPIFSTVTGNWLSAEQATDPEYWAQHMRRPVRFYDGLRYLWEKEQHAIFLEVGPGKTLATLASQNPDRKQAQPALSSLPHANDESSNDYCTVLEAFGQLWANGYAVNWDYLSGQASSYQAAHVKLPPYPFQRKRFWIEPVDVINTASLDGEQSSLSVENESISGSELSVVDSLKEMLSDLSGFDTVDMDSTVSFLEMGFDSLLLTQAIKELSDRFSIKVTLRQLIDGLDTINALAEHIQQTGSYQVKTNKALSQKTQSNSDVLIVNSESLSKSSAPIIQINKQDVADELTPSQRAHIDTLVKRYSEKTRQSKALTAQYRAHHADPRTASGFNRLWKEIVYQIVSVKSKGSRLIDVDGNEYIDILNGFGPGFLGHSPDHVVQALHAQLDAGFEVGPQSLVAMEAAQLFCDVTGNDRTSFVCTGSEAVYAAMRLARTCTGRDKIVMFARDYHGNFDEVLVRGIDGKNGPRSMPMAPGIPRDAVANVIVLPYGTPQALDYIRDNADQLAAVMVEPVQSRRPEFQPVEFIREVRQITRKAGSLFIFDEVVTGFRFGPKGAQAFYGVDADLVTYGKVIGGGMPLGVVSGKAEYMDTFDGGHWQYGDDSFPNAPVTFFAGTFVRHPLVMASLKSMLTFFKTQPAHFWDAVNAKGDQLAGTVHRWFIENDMPFEMPNCGSLMYLRIADDQKFGSLLGAHMRNRGVFLLEGFPSYMTAAHDDEDINYVIDAFKDSALEMQKAGMLSGRQTQGIDVTPYQALKQYCPPPRLSLSGGSGKIANAMLTPLAAPPVYMTDAQRELWLAVKFGGDTANLAYNESISLRFSGVIDFAILTQAFEQLVLRHKALRMLAGADGLTIKFVELPSLPLELIDLTTNELLLESVIAKEMQTPFLLESGPLFRAKLCLLPNQESQIILTLHHIICDGWSFGILLPELSALYSAIVNESSVELPIPDSYEKYAILEKKTANSKDIAYWLDEHNPMAAELDLPSDYSRPAQRTFAADRVDVLISKELTQQLRQLARKNKVGFFALTYTAFCIYIARLAQRDDVVIGVPYAGQLSSGMNQLVGHCVNILPFRIKINSDKNVGDLLQHINKQLLTGFDHSHISMASLLSAMKIKRDASRIPLIPITFNLDKTLGDLVFGHHTAQFSSNVRIAETFEIALNLEDRGETLEAQWSFNTSLFSRETIRFRADAFSTLLEAIVQSPDMQIKQLPIISVAERLLLQQWNATERDTSDLLPVTLGFKVAAQQYPEKTAIECNGEAYSYREAYARVQQIALTLKEQSIEPGSLVAIFLHRGVDLPLAMLAVMEIGCAYVPLDPHQPEQRILHILDDAKVSCIITNTTLPVAVAAVVGQVIDLNLLPFSAPVSSVSSSVSLSDNAYVIYTSGSTGKPKGVVIQHLGLANIVRSFQRAPGFELNDRLLAITTAAFDIAGLELFLPLVTGATVVIAEENTARDPEKLSQILNEKAITVLQCVPTTWQLLLNYGHALPKNLRGWCGGEALSADVAAKIPKEMNFWNVYGPTETTIWSTIQPVNDKQLLTNKSVSIGKPIDNTSIYILDDEKNQLPIGVTGNLWIGGAGVAAEYYRRADLTAERFCKNPFAVSTDPRNAHGVIYDTGDIARLNNSGSLEYSGRKDFQVKVRGFRIELGEIESILLRHDSVRACVVHAHVVHDKTVLAAYIVAKDSMPNIDALRHYLHSQLPDYMVPSVLVPLDALPLNTNGKVDRAQLYLPDTATLSSPVNTLSVAPSSDLEIIISHCFKEHLNIQNVNVTDNFFELGGDSLSAIQVILQLNEEMNTKLPLAILLTTPTVKLLADYIKHKGSSVSIKSIVPLRYEEGGVPVFCLMGIQIYASLANSLGAGYSVYALLGKKENDFLQGIINEDQHLSLLDIDGLAHEYMQLILGTGVVGPYRLLGFSSGGVVAIQVAKLLQAQGQQVELVGLLDTVLPRGIISPFHFKIKQAVKSVRDSIYKHILHNTRLSSRAERSQSLLQRRGDILWKAIERWDKKMNSYDGRVVIFQATDLSDMGSVQLQRGLGWQQVLKKSFDVFDIQSAHGDLLNHQNAEVIAKCLRDCDKGITHKN